jgi:serine/threonine-protein kinase Chk2
MTECGPTQALGSLEESCQDAAEVSASKKIWGRLISLNSSQYPNIELEKDETTLGRHSGCDHQFNQPGISGIHCKIIRERISQETFNHLVWVEDLSTNGTFIGRDLIGKGKRVLLNSGMTISLLKPAKNINYISYLYQDVKEDLHEMEEGGPQKDYDIREVLGTGNFATVKLAIHKATGEKYAIKIIDKKKFLLSSSSRRKNTLMDEVNILKRVSHPNIISIKDVYESSQKLYLVLELVTGGELFDRILTAGRFDEDKAREFFIQMLQAVDYLHEQNIVHRDLKPENILLKSKTEDIIKISDFGLSRVFNENASMMKTMCGTPQYVAPEVLTDAQSEGYGPACDLWSLGVILYILLSGKFPFKNDSTGAVYEQIKTANFVFDNDWDNISEEAKDLIRHLLTVDPKKRWTAKEALNSPWIRKEKLHNSSRNETPNTSVTASESGGRQSVSTMSIVNSSSDFPTAADNRKDENANTKEVSVVKSDDNENNSPPRKRKRPRKAKGQTTKKSKQKK